MRATRQPRRFRGLPTVEFPGEGAVPVALSLAARTLGLALLDRASVTGLLIPRCGAVHTVGMRFPLDLRFLDARGRLLGSRLAVPANRFAREPGARWVLELPSAEMGAR